MSEYEQRNRDFCRGMTGAQFAYIEAERRVVELEDENAELKSQVAEYAADAGVYKEMVDDLRVALSGRNRSVYVVVESDELMTEGIPTLAFWDAEAATKCSHERQHEDEDGIRHFAWVEEVKVVAE